MRRRIIWVWLCSVRARARAARRAEVRDTRVCVSLLLGTVAAEAKDCRCLGGGDNMFFTIRKSVSSMKTVSSIRKVLFLVGCLF